MSVLFDPGGSVATITINRPERRNAIDADVAIGLEASIDRFEQDDDLRVALLCGHPSAFSAGADLKVLAAGERMRLQTDRGGFAGFVRRQRTKPIIAVVEGPAVAGGFEIALACDLIVASTAASFGLPEVHRSVIAAAGGLLRLPAMIPQRIAVELALTGQPISATRAFELGLVSAIAAPGEARAAGMRLASKIAEAAPLAIEATLRVIAGVFGASDAAWTTLNEEMTSLELTEDFVEGSRAFLDKRDPSWRRR